MFDSLIQNFAAAPWAPATLAFGQVLMIDLVLAGDNAVAVGLAAAGVPEAQRKKVILYGLAAAVTMRIGFALITTQLLGIIGLSLAGGVLLLWVCWKMWTEIQEQAACDRHDADIALEQATGVDVDSAPGVGEMGERKAKTFGQALIQILIADLSMSLDNVLAVAGAAREHPVVLALGLLMSIALMGVAATWIAKLLQRHRWIGYVGLFVVLYVALHMIWDGHRKVVEDLHLEAAYNQIMPGPMDIPSPTP
jgi:YjbE family integral membrane protein